MELEPPAIDLAPLRRSGATLDEALDFWRREPDGSPLKRHLRSSVIRSFEFVYELVIRLLRRTLIERAASAERAGDLSFNDLLRGGADAGLIVDPMRWRVWCEMRNSTSHADDEAKAEAVAGRVGDFAADAKALLRALEAAIGE